jgi:hypothetical protein
VIIIFSILGLAVSIMALSGLVAKQQPPVMKLLHCCAVILVIVAWWAGHLTTLGWGALLGATGAELAVLGGKRKGGQPMAEAGTPGSTAGEFAPARNVDSAASTMGTGQPAEADNPSRHTPTAPPAPAAPPFTTSALLRKAWEPSADVFLASLRRGGLREAELAEKPADAGPIRLRVGSITLELISEAKPMPAAEIDYAAAQSWEWPDALTAVTSHEAHVLLTTRTTMDTPRAEVVQLHRQAQAALAEFAPVVAVMWRAAGRLVPISPSGDNAPEACPDEAPTTWCVNFRMFPPSEAKPNQYVSDSVGLHAFGLPDIQIATASEPDEAVSTVLYDLAVRFFAAGCEVADGCEMDFTGLGRWRATRCRAVFEPEREVIELARVEPAVAGEPPEQPGG